MSADDPQFPNILLSMSDNTQVYVDMTARQLKVALERRRLPTDGDKNTLIARLQESDLALSSTRVAPEKRTPRKQKAEYAQVV